MADDRYFDLIRTFRLFRKCTDDFVRAFAHRVVLKKTAAGDLLLSQGQINSELSILCSGRAVVLVDDDPVAILETPGDPIGEISVLISTPASATVRAETDVEVFVIDVRDLDDYTREGTSGFGYQLYRAFTEVLAEKIVRTNDQARRFELANRTLDLKVRERTAELETRNGELIASHRKLEELYSTKEVTFKKLIELQSHYLEPLMETIQKVASAAGPASLAPLQKAEAQIRGSIAMLQPVSDLYSTEQALRSHRVLLVEKDRKQQGLAKMALGGTGVKLDIAASIEDAITLIKNGQKFDLVFLSSEMADLIPAIRDACPKAKLVFMASSNVAAELPALKKYANDITNIVSRHPEDRTFTVKNVATTTAKLVANDFFGLEKYMIWGVEVQGRFVNSSDQRGDAIEGMLEYFKGLGIRSSIFDRAAAVAEEILMNAIYDAPVDGEGRSLFNQLSRKEVVRLEKSQLASFRYACDGMLAAISVSDPFGSFPMRTLINYLERNYSGQPDVQEDGKGGAGRGLHQIIESSDLVVFNVRRSVRTEVIALFNLDPTAVVEGAKPSFHFFLE